ncbi:MAG: tRNA lysidine(34) synthetase TilS [Chloroflexi bacterium]|nr:tRNA lysidine(34) synthetase TilS [Chloroflexota bacterium]
MLPSMDTILRNQCRLDPKRPIVVAVSGGPDSLCLMDLLRQAGYPIIVAHFNHKLRENSDMEATAVENMAARLGIPSLVESADVRAFAEEKKLSIEDAARTLRYRFLFAQARERGAQAVAVGHTADDQVETILMHFLRGAGMTGLKGMAYRTVFSVFDVEIPLVRPLLDVWREETVVYCAGQGLRPHYDPSNDSLNFLRNRIRHLLIPNLETYNPKFREAVWRTGQSLQADHEILTQSVDAAWARAVVNESDGLITFDASTLTEFPLGLTRYLFRRAMERIQPLADISYALLDRVTAFLQNGKTGGSLPLIGGIRLLREGNQVFVAGENAVLPFEAWPQLPADADSLLLSLPSRVDLPGGWRFSCESWNIPALAREQMQDNEDPFQVWLDADTLQGDLTLRVRREGDRFEPLGLDGHSQKLSDFFTNEKLAQRARDRWPLLCAGDKIAWIPGYQLAHPFRLTKASRRILYFTLVSPTKKKAE